MVVELMLAVLSAAGAEERAEAAVVMPTVETVPVASTEDAADDPALWMHPADPALSLLLGTNKDDGLQVMDLSGQQLQYLGGSEPNNVDVRNGFELAGEKVSIAVASDRKSNSLLAWKIDPAARQLIPVPVQGCTPAMEVYGLGLYQSAKSGKLYAFITSKVGTVEQWELTGNADGAIDAARVRSIALSGQNEGCAADDAAGVVYVGEEVKALWRISAEPDADATPVAVDRVKPEGRLTEDIEGVAVCRTPGGTTYVIASSQGANTFFVYAGGEGNAYIGQFTVGEGNGIDPVTHSDGIEAVVGNFGPGFESGVFVTQDDENDKGNQNFKLVPWSAVAEALKLAEN